MAEEEAEAEEGVEAEAEAAGELSDRFKDGVRVSKPDSKKSAAPPPPPSAEADADAEAEADASEGSPDRTVSVSVGQEMMGRVGGPGGRRRPKGQTTPRSALSPAGEESGPIEEADEEGGSRKEPKNSSQKY